MILKVRAWRMHPLQLSSNAVLKVPLPLAVACSASHDFHGHIHRTGKPVGVRAIEGRK